MKKRFAAIALLALVFAALASSLLSCGRLNLIGTWENTEDSDYKITFRADGKCEIVQGEYVMNLTYRVNGSNLEIKYGSSAYPLYKKGTYSIEDGILSTKIDGVDETYKKVK